MDYEIESAAGEVTVTVIEGDETHTLSITGYSWGMGETLHLDTQIGEVRVDTQNDGLYAGDLTLSLADGFGTELADALEESVPLQV